MVNFKKFRQLITVEGNGNIVTREIAVSSFIRLQLAVHGEVELIQSDEEKVVVEADENLIDCFQAVNSGRTLYVTSDNGLRIPAFTKKSVKVYYRQLDRLSNACNGDLSIRVPLKLNTPLEFKIQSQGNTYMEADVPALKLLSQCNGNVVIKGKCAQLEIKNQANGNLLCRDLVAGTVNLKNSANGNVEVHADESLVISHMGNGYVHYYGKGRLKDIRQYGNGPVKHMNG